MRKINLFVFSVILACFLITCFFYVKDFASADVVKTDYGDDNPPYPPSTLPSEELTYYFGSSLMGSNGTTYGVYRAFDRTPSYQGVFLNPRSDGSGNFDLVACACFPYDSQLTWTRCVFRNTTTSENWNNSLEHFYGLSSYSQGRYSFTASDGIRWIVLFDESVIVPSSFIDNSVYGDYIQLLSSNLSTASEWFEACKNYVPPTIIGEYDSSIPTLIRADVSFSNVTLRYNSLNQPLVQAGQINGIVSPFTNKGALTSDYYVDYQVLFGYDVVQTIPYYKTIESRSWTATKYNGGLLLDLFNDDVRSWTSSTFGIGDFSEGSKGLKVSCNAISINARLRRKSDGNFGDWYCMGVSDLGYNDTSYSINENGYKPLSKGFSGIISGSVSTPLGDFDESLTSQYNPSTSITANNIALGTSESGGVLQQGGVMDLISATGETNYDNILSYLGEVPKLIGVVFGYLPPFFISFITTAFILLVTVGIVKMLI